IESKEINSILKSKISRISRRFRPTCVGGAHIGGEVGCHLRPQIDLLPRAFARAMKTLLEDLRIATPCNADWDDMAQVDGERVRFCGKCEKNVYNLSAMSRDAAEQLVREREGRVCVRFYQRADGTVLTGDCPVAVRKQRLRRRVWASLSGAAASLMLLCGLSSGRARADLTLRDGRRPAAHHLPVI